MKVIQEINDALEGTEYRCAECGTKLGNFTTELRHPSEKDVGKFLTKMERIDCPFAGKKCEKPSIECREIN
jgi:DNA-directed RNA polymerase subunit RPC12/RpoP